MHLDEIRTPEDLRAMNQAELEARADNARAIALYESLGFRLYGRRPRGHKRPDGGYADDVLMVKEL